MLYGFISEIASRPVGRSTYLLHRFVETQFVVLCSPDVVYHHGIADNDNPFIHGRNSEDYFFVFLDALLDHFLSIFEKPPGSQVGGPSPRGANSGNVG